MGLVTAYTRWIWLANILYYHAVMTPNEMLINGKIPVDSASNEYSHECLCKSVFRNSLVNTSRTVC